MLLFLLFLLWILLCGTVTIECVVVGAAVSAALTCFTRKLFPGYPRFGLHVWRLLPNLVGYILYLIWQVVVSGIYVIRLILRPGTDHPKLVWFPVPLKGELARLALANSITLTPGTVTVCLGEDTICVYALRPELAHGLATSGFVKRLNRLEEQRHG